MNPAISFTPNNFDKQNLLTDSTISCTLKLVQNTSYKMNCDKQDNENTNVHGGK